MNHTLESFLSNLLIDQARRISPLNSETLELFRDRLENKKPLKVQYKFRVQFNMII